MFRLLLIVSLFFASHALSAAPEISGDDALRDLRIAKRGLTDLHAGLYRYITEAELDAAFDRANAQVKDGTDHAQMYLVISQLAALVRCGHTWTNFRNQPEVIQQKVFALANKLPFTVRLIGTRLLVTHSASKDVAVGAEILTIDSRSVPELIKALLPYLRADGDSDGKRMAQIDHSGEFSAIDQIMPLLYPPKDGRYALTLAQGERIRSVRVEAITSAERADVLRAQGVAAPSASWALKINGDTATMTLPTFAFWDGKFDGQAWLTDAFTRLNAEKVRYLIIDQRANEGGDDALGRTLTSMLLRAPYTQPTFRVESAYERAPYILARYLDTWDFDFFDRTGQVQKGVGRNWLFKEQPAPLTIQPAALAWRGRTIALVGPNNSSAGFLLARDLKASHAAYLIGQTTGGNLRGLNGGQLAWMTLPASKVSFDIPLRAATAPDGTANAGLQPDLVVKPSLGKIRQGIDQEMRAAQALIAAWRTGQP